MPPKAHAWVGPSSIARVLACPPSARFSEQFPDTESDFAAEGTEAHELCEYLVRKALGEKVRNPKKKLKFYNAEMQECAEGYAAYIMELYETAKQNCTTTEIMLEQRVDVSEYIPECFGPADCIIVADGTMTISDYKHGMGIKVEATDNPQLKTYALGTLAMFDFLYDINTVRLIIYQPRLENVDEWEISVAELLEWAEHTLKPTAQLAYNRAVSVRQRLSAAKELNRICSLHSMSSLLPTTLRSMKFQSFSPRRVSWSHGQMMSRSMLLHRLSAEFIMTAISWSKVAASANTSTRMQPQKLSPMQAMTPTVRLRSWASLQWKSCSARRNSLKFSADM